MTKYFKYCLENHGGGRRVAEAKSSDPATPPKFGTCTYSRHIPVSEKAVQES